MAYTVKSLMRDLRSGKFTPFGSYPTYFVAADGEPLSHEAVRENLWQVARATRDYPDRNSAPDLRQWAILGCDVNWEDSEMLCAHTGKPIECAYSKE